MQLRNFVRRQKWRLRPLKRLVLPLRNAKQTLVALLRRVPTIEPLTRNYRGTSFCDTVEVHPVARNATPPHPFLPNAFDATLMSEPASLFYLKEIDFWAYYGGSVVTSDNKLLADLSPEVWGAENHPIFSSFRLPKACELSGSTGIAVTPEAPGNYYHWLIDLLPRVGLLKSSGHELDRVLINGIGAHYEQRSLRALNFPIEKVYVTARDRFLIESAAIPSMDHFSKAIAPWKIDMLRGLRTSNAGRPAKRIYVSRKRAAVRRIINEDELANLLRSANFELLELESMTWDEQVAIFAQAEVVLAPHGAALANIAFCEPGSLIVEIGTRTGYKDFYLYLAASAQLRYRFIEARPRVDAKTDSLRAIENEDMIVDLAAVQKFLEAL
jgi:capsular polysaccharide biosynthesis protein